MAQKSDDPSLQVNFRMPASLKELLMEAAGANGRSLTAEIIARLGDSFNPPQGVEILAADFKSATEQMAQAQREERQFLQSMLQGVLEAAGDRVPERVRLILKPLRPIGTDVPDFYNNLVAKADASTVPETRRDQTRSDLEKDVRALLGLMDSELQGVEPTKPPEMSSALGEELSKAIGDRTVQAMRLMFTKLKDEGLLVEGADPTRLIQSEVPARKRA